ncbi:MAG: RNA-binding protein [Myxococcaceae bacterium]|nr:RNA-binding protein [Myxococcaceae bacterium]
MASKNLFKSWVGRWVAPVNALNEAGGPAYRLTARQALAQYAATGCLNATYYASAEGQLAQVLKFCAQVEPEFIARTAVYCRERAMMKDMPALLCAVLSVRSPALLGAVFDRVIDDGKMLRNFVQIMRSGAVGRKSLGTRPKKLVLRWLETRSDETVFRAAVGQEPSLADVVRMVHPKPATAERKALYGYLLGRPHDSERLPRVVQQFEAFKANAAEAVPNVPFQMLTSLALGQREWAEVARNASWQTTRMNLNTFARHGVFELDGMTSLVAKKLSSAENVARAKVFPYQVMMAYASCSAGVPECVREALQTAMDLALTNVPSIEGKVYVLPDVSGSMSSVVTGFREGATSVVRCIDVAGLMAAAMLRRNREAEVLPFAETVKPVRLNPRDSVLTQAQQLAQLGGGGTDCSAPLVELNRRQARGDLVVMVSDNESWLNVAHGARGTATMNAWQAFKTRNPKARLVCIDLQPNSTTQALEREDVLNVGGFSDQVFSVLADFAKGELNPNHWVGAIERVVV